ncbi:MAG: tandem-95 repeat protein, partial [Desulfuromusa sp.]|nr:tandem-95 repeat protein [Desulfuromusa sp.]
AVSGSDPDNNTLTYSSSSLPTGASFNSSGQFTWTPAKNQSGSHSVTFTVSDGSVSDSETIVITVGDVNQPPVLNPIGTKTIGEGSKLTFTIRGTDPDEDAVSYSAEGLPTGATFDTITRSFSWTPEFQATENTRIARVTFKISDGPDSDSEVVTINITNVNRAPVLAAIGSQSLTEGDSYNLIINATDPDNNQVIYTATNLPESSVFTPSTRSFNWMPGHDQEGTYSVTFRASDGSLSDSEIVSFTVNNGNEALILDAIGDQSVTENSQLIFVVSATDINGDSLTYSASGLPTGAVFDAVQQRFSWTPDYTQSGNYTAYITVTDGLFSDSETVEITVTNSNRPPVISGSPGSSVMVTTGYSFVPTASDPDGDSLTFSIANKPSWATFNSTSGELSGTPTESQVGANSTIVISVSDSLGNASLAPFSVDVIAYVHQDSDGDGVLDHLDAFPNDNSEWEDTDGDRIGNNSDLDDDNDGIADVRDGSPLDDTQSGWIITATASVGGYLTPEGETSILYGGSQGYQLTPMAGYYINDLLVDNVSVGLVADFNFENVGSHHSIAAIFVPIPTGLSYDPIAPGLTGIERVDGGDDSTNLVDNKPKQNLDFRFRVVLRDSTAVDQRKVFLILDNYKYEMQMDGGVLSNGADYIFKTRLGCAFSHEFYFSAEDVSGNQVWRYPHSGDLPGPTVELLNGKNVL